MITVVCSSQYPLDDFKDKIIKSSGLHKKIEFLGYENKGEFSLTEIYNRGLKEATNDIVVFLHHDITIETKQWGNKLLKMFEKHPEYGILGVAGTKYMPASGRWWENPKKMYGRVAHTHEGKTWLSTYSEDLNQEIEEAVTVDGVFFAINKTKIKKSFNEEVIGFHFYDVTFCFENYLEGVKIGVTTTIRINHKSIGITNDEWENNRQQFAERFKDNLPVSIKKVLRKGEKLKIMMTSLAFDDNSSKSKIILELANKLRKNNHDVTICSNVNGRLPMSAKQNGIKLAPIQQPPGFALGDGKWTMNTPNGQVASQPNTLYKIKEFNYDIIHIFDDEIIEHMNKLYAGTVLVNTKSSNSLFVNTDVNPLVKSTIDISNDISEVQKIDIDNIVKGYNDVI